MARKKWLPVVVVLPLMGIGGKVLFAPVVTRGADQRIAHDRMYQLERELGHHLYAPTWLPHGGRVGETGPVVGARRILMDYSDAKDRSLLIISQEPRTSARDEYHQRLFGKRAEARAEVKGRPAFFVTGESGERRLFWNEPQMAVILSSPVLSDEELLQIAQKMR